MLRARIVGTGSYAPEKVVTNDELAAQLAEINVETSDEWIRTRTGIAQRHFAPEGEDASDMAAAAGRSALQMAGIEAKDLDLIVVGTVTADMPMPACAAFVQHKIGATCPAFDLSAACAGSIYALKVAEQFIRGGGAKNVLVVGVELLSRILDWHDRTTCVLFGDAAGAMVLRAESGEQGVISCRLATDGALTDILKIPGGGSKHPLNQETVDRRLGYVVMNGREVYRTAVRALSETMLTTLKESGIGIDDLHWVVPHQANIRIVDTVFERLNIPKSKAVLNIEKYGNTSSASVPVTLDEGVRDGRIREGHLVGLMAIGAGMSWGSALVRW
ncbi:MAG: ketoacyl-ACP synthase III [Myxococcales bacterium]|nr:ketoacyl-ACP synthase III [Myxococcales bacterium]